MAKRIYRPKKVVPQKAVSETQPVIESIPTVNSEVIIEKPSEEIEQISIQITPLSPSAFCDYKKITGLNKKFLEKKYNTKSYIIEKWLEILAKENIDN